MYKSKLGERLRHIRKDLLNLTLKEFSDKVGASNSFISESEHGKTAPGAEILYSICREFSINGHWLLTGEGEPRASAAPTKRATPAAADPTKPVEETKVLEVYNLYNPHKEIEKLKEQIQVLEEEKKVLATRLDQTERIFAQALSILKPTHEEVHA